MEAAVLQILMAAWAVAETILLIRTRARRNASRRGRGGSVWAVWGVIAISLVAAMAAQMTPAPRFPAPVAVRVWAGIALMVAGLGVRLSAIVTLGRLFSVDVAIQDEHEVVRTGLYRRIRHPSYSGMIIAFAGFGIALGNWASLALAVVPTTAVILYRISVEERAMVEEFGDAYARYREETYRLFPGIY